jgi:hypothetical protein
MPSLLLFLPKVLSEEGPSETLEGTEGTLEAAIATAG